MVRVFLLDCSLTNARFPVLDIRTHLVFGGWVNRYLNIISLPTRELKIKDADANLVFAHCKYIFVS